jgi:hypothetical protein
MGIGIEGYVPEDRLSHGSLKSGLDIGGIHGLIVYQRIGNTKQKAVGRPGFPLEMWHEICYNDVAVDAVVVSVLAFVDEYSRWRTSETIA